MITWNEIITMAATPEQRLSELLGIWRDILEIYRNPRMMYFDPDTILAIVEPNYNRFLYPSNTTSVLKSGQASTKTSKDQNVKLLIEDDRNYRLVNALSTIFNQSLTKDEREIVVGTYFYRFPRHIICEKCCISKTSYYRIRRDAIVKLIMAYCLDHYDEYGIEKHNWIDVSRDRRQWNNGHFFKEDMFDWPEFNNA
ncbi:MAG: hypothetical protein IKF90_13505 [Parasporobacterium sp.]|nr:hypothetical protein [Parasporobacterium sp.]